MECAKCSKAVIPSDDMVFCQGGCNGEFHRRCTGLPKPIARFVNENKCVVYVCESCNDIAEKSGVKKVVVKETKIDDLVSEILRRCEGNVKALAESVLEKSVEKLEKIVCVAVERSVANTLRVAATTLKAPVPKVTITNPSPVRTSEPEQHESFATVTAKKSLQTNSANNKIRTIINNFDAGKASPASTSDERTGNATDLHSKAPKKSVGTVRPGALAADRVVDGSALQPKVVKKDVAVSTKERAGSKTLVIVPKVDQSCDKTRCDLRARLDPRKHQVSDFRNGRKGQIFVQCPATANINDVRKEVQSKLGDAYSARLPLSRIRILGMTERYSESEVIELLKAQNIDIPFSTIDVITIYENKFYKYQKYNVVLDIDKESAQRLDNVKKVKIGFDSCAVSTAVHVLRCFRCGQYGHKSSECKKDEACSKCSGAHRTSECSSSILKCVNCVLARSNKSTGHAAFSSECPVYIKHVSKLAKHSQ